MSLPISIAIPDPGEDTIQFVAVRRVNGKLRVCRVEGHVRLLQYTSGEGERVIWGDIWRAMHDSEDLQSDKEPPR